MSSLTWLDFSEADQRRALQIVELLGRTETRDELGLGAIRDAFGEALFPGISTIQRRARYFLFVPWTLREIERRHVGRHDALERARKQELRTIEALLASREDETGIIGGRVRKDLRQLPSMIYWSGLARWGIRRREGTREQWARGVARSSGLAIDDDGQVVGDEAPWWDPALPDPPDGWPTDVSLRLSPDEAEYLRHRIRQACGRTMLAVLAERSETWGEVPFPWMLDVPGLDEEQRRVLAHARRFSEAMHGAALLYNLSLARAREDPERENEYESWLAEWAAEEALADRESAPLPELWPLLGELGSRHSVGTRRFVEEWVAATAEPRRALDDATLVASIRDREREVKGRQARLTFDAALETWRGAAGTGQLDYRWPVAQRELLDIVQAAHAA